MLGRKVSGPMLPPFLLFQSKANGGTDEEQYGTVQIRNLLGIFRHHLASPRNKYEQMIELRKSESNMSQTITNLYSCIIMLSQKSQRKVKQCETPCPSLSHLPVDRNLSIAANALLDDTHSCFVGLSRTQLVDVELKDMVATQRHHTQHAGSGTLNTAYKHLNKLSQDHDVTGHAKEKVKHS